MVRRVRPGESPARRILDEIFYRALCGTARLVSAFPASWLMTFADGIAFIVYVLAPRGRRVGRQNLAIVFGDELTSRQRKRIVWASIRGVARGVATVFHAAPLTERRFRRWVEVPTEVEKALQRAVDASRGAVIVTAHIGSWETLLGMASLFPGQNVKFLVEASVHPSIDRFLAFIRGSGGGESAQRRGGAQALNAHLRRGGIAGLVIDRNARRERGGIWAPFFGLAARTTPLPALLARRNEVPIAPLFCRPLPDGRYRVHLGPEVSMDVRSDDTQADVLEITTRLNRLVEEEIRRCPEAWNWNLKRFKSRPTEERGEYPSYSFWDPDP